MCVRGGVEFILRLPPGDCPANQKMREEVKPCCLPTFDLRPSVLTAADTWSSTVRAGRPGTTVAATVLPGPSGTFVLVGGRVAAGQSEGRVGQG